MLKNYEGELKNTPHLSLDSSDRVKVTDTSTVFAVQNRFMSETVPLENRDYFSCTEYIKYFELCSPSVTQYFEYTSSFLL